MARQFWKGRVLNGLSANGPLMDYNWATHLMHTAKWLVAM